MKQGNWVLWRWLKHVPCPWSRSFVADVMAEGSMCNLTTGPYTSKEFGSIILISEIEWREP